MLEPKASRFYQATLQSGLADDAALQTCWDAISPAKRTAEHIDRRLARQAVQTGVLTLWQAQQLIAGRSTGFKVDRYTLLDLIGQGGMGRVYLALDTRLNRRVAVKILSPERVNNPRAIARFHREARVGAQLQHENLVRIYDEGESSGKCYLVMEYIEGKNIGQMMAESGPVPSPVAARLARQVALGLEHAQRKGLIHRDVNPYNILVTRDGTAKLTDLGLAIDLADQDRVTRDGATVGTFDYVSPEQARHSHSVDTRSDIYSLGCTLYHMLTGRVPFPGASLPEKLFGHQAREPEPIAGLAPGVPEGLVAVVSRTMRKSPDDRYATPWELAQALEPFVDDSSPVGAGAEGTTGRPPVRSEGTMTRQIVAPRTSAGSLTPVSIGPAAPAPNFTAPTTDPEPDPLPAPAAGSNGTALPSAGSDPSKAAPPAPAHDGLSGLDFGPEPSLSEGRSRPRPRPPAKPAARRVAWGVAGRNRWLVPAGAVAVAVAVAAGGVMAYRSYVRAHPAGDGGRPAASGRQPAGAGGSRPVPPRDPAVPESPMPHGQQVVVVAADGTRSVEPNLRSAMRAAVGARGTVLLLNTEPLNLSAADAAQISGGTLTIRAGEGVSPVLRVEVKGDRPFLSTRTDTPLRMEGVTVVARYTEPGKAPAPVIEAGGKVTLDRCAFRLEVATPGSRAVAVEGGDLTATGCWFEDFDRPLDVSSYGGSVASLRHCMMVQSGPDDPAARPAGSPAPAVWAVRLRSMPGEFAETIRRLKMDRCTVKGQGLLELDGFTSRGPLSAGVTGCVVSTDALLAWTPGGGAAGPGREALAWSGADNQYDVRGQSWVRLAPGSGAPAAPMPDGPHDLETWTRLLGAERDPVPPPVRFATEPSAVFERPEPRDFAVKGQGDRSVGADPAHVGPGASPLPAPRKL